MRQTLATDVPASSLRSRAFRSCSSSSDPSALQLVVCHIAQQPSMQKARQLLAIPESQLLDLPLHVLAPVEHEPVVGEQALDPVADPRAILLHELELAAEVPEILVLHRGHRARPRTAACDSPPGVAPADRAVPPRRAGPSSLVRFRRLTSILAESITKFSTPCASRKRCSQKPSRPAS